MTPFSVRTARLVLNQPTIADADDIIAYCSDPVFEHYLTIPWPYTRDDAVGFVEGYVAEGWAENREWTWAIRDADAGPLLGVIGVRMERGMVGYWLGAEHRGLGILPEALAAVIDAVFARTDLDEVHWECILGNVASMRVAKKAGFRYTGVQLGQVRGRDGRQSTSWTGVLRRDDDRAPKEGWPDIASSPHGRGVPPARRVIRLFPDDSRDYPLWESSTLTWDVGYTTTPDEYGLSAELGRALARWQAFWEKHADPFTGWDAEEHREQWVREGRELTTRLADEVAAFADVRPEFEPPAEPPGAPEFRPHR